MACAVVDTVTTLLHVSITSCERAALQLPAWPIGHDSRHASVCWGGTDHLWYLKSYGVEGLWDDAAAGVGRKVTLDLVVRDDRNVVFAPGLAWIARQPPHRAGGERCPDVRRETAQDRSGVSRRAEQKKLGRSSVISRVYLRPYTFSVLRCVSGSIRLEELR